MSRPPPAAGSPLALARGWPLGPGLEWGARGSRAGGAVGWRRGGGGTHGGPPPPCPPRPAREPPPTSPPSPPPAMADSPAASLREKVRLCWRYRERACDARSWRPPLAGHEEQLQKVRWRVAGSQRIITPHVIPIRVPVPVRTRIPATPKFTFF
eukprot:COSAG04_NODE_878_length_9680_cov_2.690951_7_plen_154_part_00